MPLAAALAGKEVRAGGFKLGFAIVAVAGPFGSLAANGGAMTSFVAGG